MDFLGTVIKVLNLTLTLTGHPVASRCLQLHQDKLPGVQGVWVFPEEGKKGLGREVKEDSKEDITKIEHGKEGSQGGNGREVLV